MICKYCKRKTDKPLKYNYDQKRIRKMFWCRKCNVCYWTLSGYSTCITLHCNSQYFIVLSTKCNATEIWLSKKKKPIYSKSKMFDFIKFSEPVMKFPGVMDIEPNSTAQKIKTIITFS